jgi:hypothetical protein
MLSCNLENLALDGVLWSMIGCMLIFTVTILIFIFLRMNKKK